MRTLPAGSPRSAARAIDPPPASDAVSSRGIAIRIALAALAAAAIGLLIVVVGVVVVGGQAFTELMIKAGDSAEHARAMYDQSVTTVVIAAVVVAALASIGIALVMGRMLARPLREVGAAARRIADGDYAARVPARGSGGDRLARRFVQPDGGQPRGAGADAARLHRQRRPRAPDAADEPAGLSRGAPRRRDRRRPGHVRVPPRGGRPARPPLALARRAGRGRRRRHPAGARRDRPRRGRPLGGRSRPAGPRAGRPAADGRSPADRCPRGRTRTTSPRSWRTSCRTRRATRPAAVSSWSGSSVARTTCSSRSPTPSEPIPPEDLDRVFERFYRVEKSRDRARGGAGIGLAIVKQLVEAGGGRVGAESAGGQTRIWFSLPG